MRVNGKKFQVGFGCGILFLVFFLIPLVPGPVQALTWTQVNTDGFGDVGNTQLYSMVVFGSNIYVGTDNGVTGCELWRSSDGTSWIQVNTDGFGDSNNITITSMAVFGADIYVGTINSISGCELWRSGNGTSWTQVNTDGFGDANNTGAYSMMVFGSQLFVGTQNTTSGCEVWASGNGTSWTQVNADGFGDPSSYLAETMVVFGSNLYVGVTNNVSGAEVWRSPNGTSWTQVNTNAFGDATNYGTASLAVFNSNLYAGTENFTTGSEVWRSADGTAWAQVNTDGFGDGNNEKSAAMAANGSYLYVGLLNTTSGCEIWRSRDGTSWIQTNADGFGDASNHIPSAMAVFNSDLYVGTRNPAGAGEAWRTRFFSLNIDRTGSGMGTVASSPVGIDCGSDCYELIGENTTVTLTATPDATSTFSGWTGDCSGSATTVIFSMTGHRSCTAAFTPAQGYYNMTVNKDGAGTGTVTSSPAGIDCGSDCEENFGSGNQVTLTATPDAGHGFEGWSGADCPGNHTCTVTMDRAYTITATFNPDDDGDGITTNMEDGGPNNGDGNGNGVKDSLEANVSSFHNINDEYVTLATDGAYTFHNVTAQTTPLVGGPEGADLSTGLYGFRIQGVTIGGPGQAILILHAQDRNLTTYYKYGPTLDDTGDHWYKFLKDDSTGAVIAHEGGKTVITLDFVDGKRGDGDLAADGVIVDPSGPGNEGGGGGGGLGGGGGGGCFTRGILE